MSIMIANIPIRYTTVFLVLTALSSLFSSSPLEGVVAEDDFDGIHLSFGEWCSDQFCNLRLFTVIGGELLMVDSVRLPFAILLCCCCCCPCCPLSRISMRVQYCLNRKSLSRRRLTYLSLVCTYDDNNIIDVEYCRGRVHQHFVKFPIRAMLPT